MQGEVSRAARAGVRLASIHTRRLTLPLPAPEHSLLIENKTPLPRNYVRVIDESGEDYLYPQSWFP